MVDFAVEIPCRDPRYRVASSAVQCTFISLIAVNVRINVKGVQKLQNQ